MLTPRPIKHKLRQHAVHGQGSRCLFRFGVQLSSTCRARPQLARYSINTKAVMGSVSPCSISHTSRSNINLALKDETWEMGLDLTLKLVEHVGLQ